MTAEPKTRRWGFFRIALTLAILVTLIVPSTRELHDLNLKLLFRVRGERTCVQGQPEGCVLYHVPNVQFTETYRQHIYDNVTASPDAFLLALSIRTYQPERPLSAKWIDHPLMDWGALMQASHYLTTQRYAKSAGASRPADQGQLPTSDEIAQVLALVRRAQQAGSDNGALWLAEAALCFHRGDDDAGLRALNIAADELHWCELRNETFIRMRDLLRKEGLSSFDATLESYTAAESPEFYWELSSQNHQQLVSMLTQAVIAHDEERVGSILTQWRALQLASWQDTPLPNIFRSLPDLTEHLDLAKAMAQRLSQKAPNWDTVAKVSENVAKETLEAQQAACRREADTLFDDYVRAIVGNDLANALRTEHEAALADRDRISRVRDAHHKSVLLPVLKSSAAGTISLLFLALTLGALLLEVPFRVTDRFQNRSEGLSTRRLLFVLAFISCTAMAGLLFSAMDATLQPVGLQRSDNRPLLRPWQEHAISALSIAILWFILRLCLEKVNRFRNVAWMSVCMLYLAAVIVTAHYRSQAIRAAEAVCSYQVENTE